MYFETMIFHQTIINKSDHISQIFLTFQSKWWVIKQRAPSKNDWQFSSTVLIQFSCNNRWDFQKCPCVSHLQFSSNSHLQFSSNFHLQFSSNSHQTILIQFSPAITIQFSPAILIQFSSDNWILIYNSYSILINTAQSILTNNAQPSYYLSQLWLLYASVIHQGNFCH